MKNTLALFVFILAALILSGCSQIEQFLFQPTATLNLESNAPTDPTPTYSETLQPEQTPQSIQPIIIWLPPEMDIQTTTAGETLKQRLDEFVELNPDFVYEVRTKAHSGDGGLLQSLKNSQTAAPVTAPSLIALTRTELQTAVINELVFPLEDTSLDEENCFEYSLQLGKVNEIDYGYPIAGDALILAYRQEIINDPQADWENIFSYGHAVLFPAASTDSLVTLAFYLSQDIELFSEEQIPQLDYTGLLNVFNFYMDGSQHNSFPYWLSQFSTDIETWNAFTAQQSHWIITWASTYLNAEEENLSALPLIDIDNTPYTIAKGWVWAIPESDPIKRELVNELAIFLSEPAFLTEWQKAAGFLPIYSNFADTWEDQDVISLLSQAAESAVLQPDTAILEQFGPILSNTTVEVIKLLKAPETAAQDTVNELNSNSGQ